jgi:hypothetical protein
MTTKTKYTLAVFALVIVTTGAVIIRSQTAKPPVYEPSEVQALRLQLKQRDARDALVAFQQAAAALNQACEAVRSENKWPVTVKCNPDTLKFADSAPPPTPPAKSTPAAKPAKK